MRAQESFTLLSNAAATGNPVTISNGGNYSLAVVATGSGNVTLQRLGPDGVTYITAATPVTATGITAVLGLAPGQYRAAVTTLTAVYAELTRIPTE